MSVNHFEKISANIENNDFSNLYVSFYDPPQLDHRGNHSSHSWNGNIRKSSLLQRHYRIKYVSTVRVTMSIIFTTRLLILRLVTRVSNTCHFGSTRKSKNVVASRGTREIDSLECVIIAQVYKIK